MSPTLFSQDSNESDSQKDREEDRSYPFEDGLFALFSQDHRNCDLNWIDLEQAIDAGDEEQIQEKWQTFEESLRRHYAMEEEVIFPAFEKVTGMTGGPTEVMRSEHAQMRGVLDLMAGLMKSKSFKEVKDQGDTLLMLAQQHNVKEENVLYPMSEQHLTAQWPELEKALKKYFVKDPE